MSYLVYRELLLPFGEWVSAIQDERNRLAARHQVPAREERFEWKELELH